MARRRQTLLIFPLVMLALFLAGCPKQPTYSQGASSGLASGSSGPGSRSMDGITGQGTGGVSAEEAARLAAQQAERARLAAEEAERARLAAQAERARRAAAGAAVAATVPHGSTPGARGLSPHDFTTVAEIRDIHFDFDRYDVRPTEAMILDANARWMKANPYHLILVEGHADERGTNEYNLALGERRAKSAMSYLIAQGVSPDRFRMISYGEERPVCGEKYEGCWSKNRRGHFRVKPQ